MTTDIKMKVETEDELNLSIDGITYEGGGGITPTGTINITRNGLHNVTQYANADVNVPSVTPTGTVNITQNGTHDVANYASANVNVPNPSTGTLNITQNGTHNVTDYASAAVNVPNTYTASDEGKVVDNGTLVAQTSRNVTQNGTYDTTTNDEVVVNVPSVTPTGTKQISITQNGTTTEDVTNYANAEITVNVPSGGGEWTTGGIAMNTEPSGNIVLPNATFIGEYAFVKKGNITGITAPNVTRIMNYSFQFALENVNIVPTSFPALTTIDSSGFRSARIGTFEFTQTAQLMKNARCFGDNGYLTSFLNRNNNGEVGIQCFYSCSALSVCDIGYATIINSDAFNGNPLTALIIRTESVCPLANINAFNNSSFKQGGTGGTIYIPEYLYNHLGDGTVDDYKSATNWSTIEGRGVITWAKVEGSIYE